MPVAYLSSSSSWTIFFAIFFFLSSSSSFFFYVLSCLALLSTHKSSVLCMWAAGEANPRSSPGFSNAFANPSLVIFPLKWRFSLKPTKWEHFFLFDTSYFDNIYWDERNDWVGSKHWASILLSLSFSLASLDCDTHLKRPPGMLTIFIHLSICSVSKCTSNSNMNSSDRSCLC